MQACSYRMFIFYIKNSNFKQFFNTKSDPNMHQNAQNCTILDNYFFRSSAMPTNPYSKAHVFAMLSTSLISDMQIPKYEKKILAPLPNPDYAPAFHFFMHFFLFIRYVPVTDVGRGYNRPGQWRIIFLLFFSLLTQNLIQICTKTNKIALF